MTTVGVRELRQRASELLAEIARTGESIEITNHGQLVAKLMPAEAPVGATRERLLASGVLRAGRGDPLQVNAVPAGAAATADLLSASREER